MRLCGNSVNICIFLERVWGNIFKDISILFVLIYLY
jgi:hypothetical protein